MILLHNSTENNYKTNGLGPLDKSIINPKIHWVKNGEYTLTFEYPLFAPLGQDIEGDMQVEVVTEKFSDVFRIKKIDKSMGRLSIYCEQKSYDLIDNFIEDINIVNLNGQMAMQRISEGTQYPHPFNLSSTITESNSARLVRVGVMEALIDSKRDNSFVNRWGGEIYRSYNVIQMHKSIGQDRGITIRHRKDLTGYNAMLDYSDVVTRIMPKGKDGLLLPEKYIDSPHVLDYAHPKIKMIDYDDVEAAGLQNSSDDALPMEQALDELRRLVQEEYDINNVDKPKAVYEVDFVSLENTKEYEEYAYLQEVHGGDTVSVVHEEDNFTIKARVTEYDLNPLTGEYTYLRLGEYTDAMSLLASIPTRQELSKGLQQVQDDVTVLIYQSANGKNSTYVSETEPVGDFLVGDSWIQKVGDGETIWHTWNGDFWEEIISTLRVSENERKVQEVDQKAQEAFTKAEEALNKIEIKLVNDETGKVVGISMINDDGAESILFQIGDDGKVQITEDYFYIKQKLITNEMLAEGISANKITSGTLDASKANIINLNAANIVGENANLVRGSFNAINTSINIDGTSLTTKGNWGGDIKLSNRGLTIYDNLANKEMGILYGLFRNEDDPLRDSSMLATGLFALDGYKLNLGVRYQATNTNYSVISLDHAEEDGFPQMNVFGNILARYDLKMFGGMLTGASNAGYSVTEANGGHCIEFANGWKIQFWRSPYQTYPSGWTDWTFPKQCTSLPRVVLAQAVRDDANMTLCNAYAYSYSGCNIRIQDKTLPWTIVAVAIGN